MANVKLRARLSDFPKAGEGGAKETIELLGGHCIVLNLQLVLRVALIINVERLGR
jgi:hypothetical protein